MSDIIEQWYTCNYKASESISVSREIWSTEHDSLALLMFSLLSVRHKCRVVDPRTYSSVRVRHCIRVVLYAYTHTDQIIFKLTGFSLAFISTFFSINNNYNINLQYVTGPAWKGYGLCKNLLFLWSFLMQNLIISIYLLCMGSVSLIISDQEDESIWKF